MGRGSPLPELHLADWRPTKETLHLYCQIVGKVRLATTPPRNHWWNAPLYVDVRGLTTRRLHHGDATFQIDFDFVEHSLVVRSHDGGTRSFQLADGVSVADFDARRDQGFWREVADATKAWDRLIMEFNAEVGLNH